MGRPVTGNPQRQGNRRPVPISRPVLSRPASRDPVQTPASTLAIPWQQIPGARVAASPQQRPYIGLGAVRL